MINFKKKYKPYPFKEAKAETFSDTTQVNAYRFTFDSWKKLFPLSKYELYENSQYPDSLIDYFLDIYENLEEKNRLTDDHIIQARPVDDSYFQYASNNDDGSREITFVVPKEKFTQSEIAETFKTFGLNYSLYLYAMVVVGIPKNKLGACKLSQETVKKITDYFTALVNDPNFSVYVAPYLVNPVEFLKHTKRFKEMAKAYFDDNVNVSYMDYEHENNTVVNNFVTGEEIEAATKVIPVIIKEVHPTGALTVKEIRQYQGASEYTELDNNKSNDMEFLEQFVADIKAHLGRFANKIILDDFMLDTLGLDRNKISTEEVFGLIERDLNGHYKCLNQFPITILRELVLYTDLPRRCSNLVDEIHRQTQS